MRTTKVIIAILALIQGVAWSGCGLQGTRAEFLGPEGEYYIFRDWSGRELRLKGHKNLRKEPDLMEGDQVQVYYTEEGLVQFIARP